MKLNVITAILVLLIGSTAMAQKDSSNFKNTVRFNITNPMIFGERSIIFGYERTINDHQSFSVNIGQASFPSFSLINYDSLGIDLKKDFKDKGFNFSVDYRMIFINTKIMIVEKF